ncbi:MAG: fibronectin type III domain-containing protein, partial [Elusimicrobia bacterium]|nr:fibronectin type III domain-containing protein [Elusimicrobiota bacterium]
PGTSFYIDSGLAANKVYTRWLTLYQGATPGSDSQHIEKYTYALPPSDFTLESVTAESAYITWHFSTATAYAVECSSTAGASYVRIRDIFVPWQTIKLLSNRNYLIRLGAVNGDNELTPGNYSALMSTTTPPLDMTMTGVALSSYAIQWQWSTGTFTGTGVTGYRIYHSTLALTGALPAAADAGEVLQAIGDPAVNSWTETFVDITTETWSVATGSVTTVVEYAANTRRTRWMKAVGILESTGRTPYRKYTYATAPATAAVGGFGETIMSIGAGGPFRASDFAVDYATAPADFSIFVSSVVGTEVGGLMDNTKYDFRLGAINGDNELTPYHFSYATSAVLRAMTMPVPPFAFAAAPLTDTVLNFSWSTSTYLTPGYINGYWIGVDCYIPAPIDKWTICQEAFAPGVSTNLYGLDYLFPNSVHTRYVKASQTDPAWIAGNPHFDASPQESEYEYVHIGSGYTAPATGATFATPPNDVSFYSVRSSTVGLRWNEPVVPATKYRVERSTNTGEKGPWVFVSSVTGASTQDTGLTPSTTYSYRIGAINLMGLQTIGLSTATGGNRRDYSFVSSTITKHISPTLSGVATSTTSITWSWTNTVPGVLSYNFYTSTDGVLSTGIGGTIYPEINLSSANVRYTRRVRSLTNLGEGDYSEASVSTLASPPAAPVITSSGVHTMSVGWSANGSAGYSVARSLDQVLWPAADVFVSTYAFFNDTRLRYATTYYYAVRGLNDDGFVSVSSAVTAANMTLPLPAAYTPLFSTAAVSQTVTAPLPGLGQLTITVAAGAAPDGYLVISTSAGTSPQEISKSSLDAATAKLVNALLVGGSIVELHFYDVYGVAQTANLASPARLTMTYTDANGDDILDGSSPPVQASTLKLFSLDTSALVWNLQRNSVLDKTAGEVYAYIPHFSFYALGSITSAAGALTDVFAYPNPYRPGTGGDFGQSAFGDGIVFQSLPARAKVRIYSLSGAQVAELSDDDGDGRCLWNTRNQDGAKGASGVSLYSVTGPGSSAKKTGKVAIIR